MFLNYSNFVEDLNELEKSYHAMKKTYDDLEIASLLCGDYDSKKCYLEIHPGAGGTEACLSQRDLASSEIFVFKLFKFCVNKLVSIKSPIVIIE